MTEARTSGPSKGIALDPQPSRQGVVHHVARQRAVRHEHDDVRSHRMTVDRIDLDVTLHADDHHDGARRHVTVPRQAAILHERVRRDNSVMNDSEDRVTDSDMHQMHGVAPDRDDDVTCTCMLETQR